LDAYFFHRAFCAAAIGVGPLADSFPVPRRGAIPMGTSKNYQRGVQRRQFALHVIALS
jgi:hypothetical protein